MKTSFKSIGTDFGNMMDEAKNIATNGENENIIVVVAKKDGQFHVLTDIEYPMTMSLMMLQGAAKAMWQAKRERVQETKGEPEIVES